MTHDDPLPPHKAYRMTYEYRHHYAIPRRNPTAAPPSSGAVHRSTQGAPLLVAAPIPPFLIFEP
ncbi:putative serine/threonine-protein kinase [Sesbania bispinosa]|nr:putative serine/threonine-protein kinase [Sesbania bispinosa]